MCEQLLQRITNSPSDSHQILKWLQGSLNTEDDIDFQCSRSDFSSYFINYIRVKTQGILNSEEIQNTPSVKEKQIFDISNFPKLCEIKSVDSPISNQDENNDTLHQSTINNSFENKIFNEIFSTPFKITNSNDSAPKLDKILKTPESSRNNTDSCISFKTQTKSDIHESSSEKSSFEVLSTPKRNISLDKGFMMSPITPVNHHHSKDSDNSSHKFSTPNITKTSFEYTPNSKFNTPNNHYKDRRSSNQRNICIADFLTPNKNNSSEVTAPTKKKRNRFLNLSLNDPLINAQNRFSNNISLSDNHCAFNIEDKQMFPDTLSTSNQNYDPKTNSRNIRRRIKPTKLNNSFPNENHTLNTNVNGPLGIKFGVKYDKPEQNDAFKIQNCQITEHSADFETERDILKKEKTNLIQKFNEINTPKKILTNNTPANVIIPKVESKKIVIEFNLERVENLEVLEIFSSIFSVIIDSNLIPNIISEVYYLISLIVLEASCDKYSDEHDKTCETNLPLNCAESNNVDEQTICDTRNEIFENVHNVVYFALSCLEKQKNFLNTILDKNSLRLFLKNYKIKIFSSNFADSLSHMLTEKINLDDKNNTNPVTPDTLNKNVYFISETDNADNFPTKRDFLTFKSQRDGFYEIFREWETNHQQSGWIFDRISPKIRSLINLSSSPSNLTHLARLFKAQLLVSCSEKKKTEKQETLAHLQSVIGSCGVNQDKLNKLTERLTAALPDQVFSVDQKNLSAPPDFTGHEEFFKNFILASSNSSFREHLINGIIQEIYKLDESGCTPSENEDSGTAIDTEAKIQYLECLRSLRILAKFLGFLMSIPYDTQEVKPSSKFIDTAETKENSHTKIVFSDIYVRNLTLPPIDLILILNNSYRKHRLVLTIPWIVQLLAMLDYCSLRLLYFKKLHQMLFDIYGSNICKLNVPISDFHQISDADVNLINQSSHFQEVIIPNDNKSLIRICLGWLFDLQNFPRDLFYTWLKYTSLKGSCENNNFEKHLNPLNNFIIFSKNDHKSLLFSRNENEHRSHNNANVEMTNNLNEDDIKKMYNLSLELKEDNREFNLDSLNIIDHNIITEVCPFLKDFRLLFLKNIKSSNTKESIKNIRHITPVTSSFNVDKSKRQQKELQVRLEEWFLRSQPGTTRRTLELVSERTGAALVRLAKTQIPTYSARAYNAVKDHVNNYVSDKNGYAIAEVYNRELLDFHLKCKRAGEHIGSKRVRCALQGLLPPGTHSSVQEMCIQICIRNAVRKLIHCLETQYNDIHVLFEGNNFLIKALSNINNEYFAEQRVVVMHQFNKENTISLHGHSNKFSAEGSESYGDTVINASKNFDDSYYSPTFLLIELKESVIEILNGYYSESEVRDKVFLLLKKIYECSSYSYVDKSMKNMFLQLLIDLTMLLVCANPLLINDEYLSKASKTWLNCYDHCNNITTDIKPDVSNLEISYFEKLMGNESDVAFEESSNKLNELYHKKVYNADQDITNSPIKSNLSFENLTNDENVIKEENHSFSHQNERSTSAESTSNYFNTLLCSRNLLLLKVFFNITKNVEIWVALKNLFTYLVNNNFLTKDSLIEQFLSVYRQDWPQEFLLSISNCMKHLIDVFKLHDDKRLSMILEFMSDYCVDLDDF